MTAKLKVPTSFAPRRHTVLDPRSLGRPVHLLKDFASELRTLIEDLFRQALNRRYRAGYALGEIGIEPAGAPLPPGAWLSAEHRPGRLSCLLERSLVLSVMHYRYGAQAPLLGAADVTPAETSTEERLTGLLGQQILQGLATRLIDAGPAAAAVSFAPALRLAPAPDAWLIRVPVRDESQGLDSTLLLAIDGAWMNQLLREREPHRAATPATTALPQPRELAARLPLKLAARLLQTEMPLGELMDLKPGAVIPVSLKATEVLVDGERLFTASVAEHQGKLCLTSFADAD